MFYMKKIGVEGAYIVSTDSDGGFEEMDDDLFEEGYGGNLFLKSFLKNPTDKYLKEKDEYELEDEIASLKRYLSDTDYVISKLNELKLEDEDEYESAKEEYSEVLRKRKEARARINELEG